MSERRPHRLIHVRSGRPIYLVLITLTKRMQTLMAVSDPRSPRYGQHLSIDDITALVGPPPSHAAAVRGFLLAYGLSAARIHVNRNGCGTFDSFNWIY